MVRELDAVAHTIVHLSPAELVKREVPTAKALQAKRSEAEHLQARMIALQEELDWLCYRVYGLIEADPLGERPGAEAVAGSPAPVDPALRRAGEEKVGPPPSAVPTPRARPASAEFRRKLPHLQEEGKTLFVTFCTEGRWMLPKSVRGLVLEHCLHDHGIKYHMHAAVVMPDHVHLLYTPRCDAVGQPFGLWEILSGIKGASAHRVNRTLGRTGSVWQREWFDRLLRAEETIEEKAIYICLNPVRKGLVGETSDYPFLWRESREGKEGVFRGMTAEGGGPTLGLAAGGMTAEGGGPTRRELPGLALGQTAFEIVLARRMAAGESESAWFDRHGSTPITEIPEHWPEEYRTLVARRIAAIQENPNIALIERPEYKRRWNREPWDDQVKRALRSWLLERLESGRYWPDPAQAPPGLVSCAALANIAAQDAEFQQVAALYAGRPDFDLARLVGDLVASESVPFLPVLRYKPSGLTKRQVWERTWDLQRREDAGEDVGPIPVPPKYTSADFLTGDIWRLRGKLDVPKERFVSYPHCGRDGDPSLVVGWAGWDHLRQAQALAAYYERMKTREGWPPERLVPLLAGLDQLVPWLIQWHNDVDPEYDLRMGDYYRDFVRDEAQGLGYTLDRVWAWEPPAKVRGGRGRK